MQCRATTHIFIPHRRKSGATKHRARRVKSIRRTNNDQDGMLRGDEKRRDSDKHTAQTDTHHYTTSWKYAHTERLIDDDVGEGKSGKWVAMWTVKR